MAYVIFFLFCLLNTRGFECHLGKKQEKHKIFFIFGRTVKIYLHTDYHSGCGEAPTHAST